MTSLKAPAVTLLSRRIARATHRCELLVVVDKLPQRNYHGSVLQSTSAPNLAIARNIPQVQTSCGKYFNHATEEEDRQAYRLRDVTKRLLCPTIFPVGTYHLQAWMHAEASICAWAWATHKKNRQQPRQLNNITKAVGVLERLTNNNKEIATSLNKNLQQPPQPIDIAKAMELLERLVQEAAHNINKADTASPSPLPKHIKIILLNTVLQGWRDCRKQAGGNASVMSLAFVWHKIQQFRSLVPSLRPDANTYQVLLDSFVPVARHGFDFPDLAESILFTWLEESQQGDNAHLSPPDVQSIRSVMNGWNQNKRPEAAQKVKVLQQLLREALVRDNGSSNRTRMSNTSNDDYQKLLDACQQQDGGGFDKAETILDYMMENEIPTLGTPSLNAALTAMLQQPNHYDSLLARVKALLDRVRNHGIDTDRETFDILMTLGRKCNGGSRHHILELQTLFDELLTQFQNGRFDLHSDLVHFHQSLLQAWANAGEPLQAEALLDRMLQAEAQSKVKELVVPNWTSVALVLEAWLQSERRDAPQRAHNLVDRIVAINSAHSLQQPTAHVYAALMNIWRHSRQSDRDEQAQAIFDQLVVAQPQQEQQKGQDLLPRPNEQHYRLLSQVWAEAGNVEKAESILLDMSRNLYSSNPNAQVTMALMDVWMLAKQENAAEKSERIVNGMLRQYDSSNATLYNLKPTRALFRQLLHVWRHATTRRDRGDQAQACFDNMCARYEKGDLELRPTLDTYNALLGVWASVGRVDQVEALMTEMDAKYGIEPDFGSVAALIDAWSASQRQDALHQACLLFHESLEAHRKKSGSQALPATAKQTYWSMMRAWATSGRGEAGAAKVQALLDDLKVQYVEHGNLDLRPQARHYSVAVEAWAKAGRPDKAESLIREVIESENIALDALAFSPR